MPKNFPFYNPEHHQKIIALLENKKPAAIIAATGKNPELAGAVYPFPMFEDGDFDIPSVYMKDVEGEKLRKYVHEKITVQINSKRIPAKAMNVIARKGDCSKSKIIFCAHIDAKKGTPGALDDGGGIAALLGIAELLTDYSGEKGIEIIAFNGEDYYDAPGQKQYLQQHQSKMEKIELAVNLDGVGYIDGRTGYSFYECPESMENRVKEIMAAHEEIYEGEQWYQGDHMIFVLNQRPAIAFASENFNRIMTEIAHTEKDTVDLVDCKKLAKLACALRDIALKV